MLREIKFRAWAKEEREMIQADTLAFEEYAPLSHLLNDRDDLIIMQSTGVKDKNGKEIYESDIVKFTKHGEEHIGFINYWGCEWLISGIYKLARECNKGIEVIGNTFDNPNMEGDFLNSKD